MVLIRILIMSKSGFEDEVLIKLIVGVVKHVKAYPSLTLLNNNNSYCYKYTIYLNYSY
jgi:hypothetical protein